MKQLKHLVLFVIVFLAFFAACSHSQPKILPATVSIDSTPGTRILKPALFGSNLQWEWKGDGILDASQKFEAKALDLAKALGLSHLRFPGGSLSNSYRWKDGIGKADKRLSGLSFAKKKIPSYFGTDEFLALSDQLKVKPVITLNSAQPANYALEWLKYIESHQAALIKGSYWEVGNEVYSPNEAGHALANQYAKRVNAFAAKLRSAHKDLNVGAALEISFSQAAWMEQVFPHLLSWNEQVIQRLSKDINFVSLHFYAPFDKYFSDSKLAELTLAGPIVFQQNLDLLEQQLIKHQRTDIKFAITEYNTFFGDNQKLDKRTATAEAALFLALMVFEMADNPRVTLANHWSLLNNAVFGLFYRDTDGTWKIRPSFDVIKVLATQKGNRIQAVKLSSPSYSVDAKGNIPQLNKVPMLAAMVTSDSSGQRYYNFVNRSSSVTLELELRDPSLAQTGLNVTQWSEASWIAAKPSSSVTVVNGKASLKLAPLSFTLATQSAAPLGTEGNKTSQIFGRNSESSRRQIK